MRLFGDNEFDRIYEGIRDSGFEFVYNNRRLSKSKLIYQKDIRQIPESKGNADRMFVKCGTCGVYMDFADGVDTLGGRWVCPSCGVKVRERTAYTQLDRENNDFLNDWDLDE